MKPGPRYGNRRYDPLRNSVLDVSVRTGDAKPKTVPLSPTRRGLLEAVAAGKVRYVASVGWRCGRRTVNSVVADRVRGGWVTASTVGAARLSPNNWSSCGANVTGRSSRAACFVCDVDDQISEEATQLAVSAS